MVDFRDDVPGSVPGQGFLFDPFAAEIGLNTQPAQDSLQQLADVGESAMSELEKQIEDAERLFKKLGMVGSESIDDINKQLSRLKQQQQLLNKADERLKTNKKQTFAYLDPTDPNSDILRATDDVNLRRRQLQDKVRLKEETVKLLKAEQDRVNLLEKEAQIANELFRSGKLKDQPERIQDVVQATQRLSQEIEKYERLLAKRGSNGLSGREADNLKRLKSQDVIDGSDLADLKALEEANKERVAEGRKRIEAQKQQARIRDQIEAENKQARQKDLAAQRRRSIDTDRALLNSIPGLRPAADDPIQSGFLRDRRNSAISAFTTDFDAFEKDRQRQQQEIARRNLEKIRGNRPELNDPANAINLRRNRQNAGFVFGNPQFQNALENRKALPSENFRQFLRGSTDKAISDKLERQAIDDAKALRAQTTEVKALEREFNTVTKAVKTFIAEQNKSNRKGFVNPANLKDLDRLSDSLDRIKGKLAASSAALASLRGADDELINRINYKLNRPTITPPGTPAPLAGVQNKELETQLSALKSRLKARQEARQAGTLPTDSQLNAKFRDEFAEKQRRKVAELAKEYDKATKALQQFVKNQSTSNRLGVVDPKSFEDLEKLKRQLDSVRERLQKANNVYGALRPADSSSRLIVQKLNAPVIPIKEPKVIKLPDLKPAVQSARELDNEVRRLTSEYLKATKAADGLQKANKGFVTGDVKKARDIAGEYEQKLRAAVSASENLGNRTANLTRAQAALAGAYKTTNRNSLGFLETLGRIGLAVYGIQTAARTVAGGFNLIKAAFVDTNVQLEQAQLAIAGVFNNAYIESFSTSMQRAKGFVENLREEAVKTNLTFQELFQAATTALPQLINRGATEEQALRITSIVSQAGKFALGDRYDPSRLNDEIRGLLNKQVSGRTNETLQFLGITQADLKPLKNIAELQDLLVEKTRGLEAANKEFQKTFLGGTDRMQDEFFRLGTELGKPIFRTVTAGLINFNNQLMNGDFDGAIQNVEVFAASLSKLVVVLSTAIEGLKEFAKTPTGKLVGLLNPATAINAVSTAYLAKNNPVAAISSATSKEDLQATIALVSQNREANKAALDSARKKFSFNKLLQDQTFATKSSPVGKALNFIGTEGNVANLDNIKKIEKQIKEADTALSFLNIAEKAKEFAPKPKAEKLPPGVPRDGSSIGLGTEAGNRAKKPREFNRFRLSLGLANDLERERSDVEIILERFGVLFDQLSAKANNAKTIIQSFAKDGIGALELNLLDLSETNELANNQLAVLQEQIKKLTKEQAKAKEDFFKFKKAAESAAEQENAKRAADFAKANSGTEDNSLETDDGTSNNGRYERISPLDGEYPVTGRFGEKRKSHNHQGLDIAAPTGTPVLAPLSGDVLQVVTSGNNGGRGKFVVIRTDDGLVNRFFHLSKTDVKAGDRVKQGQQIGSVGNTGHSSGSHLHFEVANASGNQDPRKYLGRLASGKGLGGAQSSTGDGENVEGFDDIARDLQEKAQLAEQQFNIVTRQLKQATSGIQDAQKKMAELSAQGIADFINLSRSTAEFTKEIQTLKISTEETAQALNFDEGERAIGAFGLTALKGAENLRVLKVELEKVNEIINQGGFKDSESGSVISFESLGERGKVLRDSLERSKTQLETNISFTQGQTDFEQSQNVSKYIDTVFAQAQEQIQQVELKKGEVTQRQIDEFKFALQSALIQVLERIAAQTPGSSLTVTDFTGRENQATLSPDAIKSARQKAEQLKAINRDIANSYRIDIAEPLKNTFDGLFDTLIDGGNRFGEVFLNLFRDIARQAQRVFSQLIFDSLKAQIQKSANSAINGAGQAGALGQAIGLTSLLPIGKGALPAPANPSALNLATQLRIDPQNGQITSSIIQGINNSEIKQQFNLLSNAVNTLGSGLDKTLGRLPQGTAVPGSPSSVGSFAGFMKGPIGLGLLGSALMFGGNMLASKSKGVGGALGGVGLSTGGGALAGAAIGSVVPGIGTAIGAIVGGLAGAGTGISSNGNAGGFFSTKGGIATAFALGGPLGFLALASRKKRIAKETQMNDQQNRELASRITAGADADDLRDLQKRLSKLNNEWSRQNKAGKRGKQPLRDAAAQIAAQIKDLKERAREAERQIRGQIEDFARPTYQRGIVPDIKKRLEEFKQLLKMGVNPALVVEAFNKEIEDQVRTMTEELNEINKQIAQGDENDRGELVSLQTGMQDRIKKIQEQAQQEREALRQSAASEASNIISEGRAQAIIPSAASRQQRLSELAAQQKKDEDKLNEEAQNGILKEQNQTAREIAGLQAEAVKVQSGILLLLSKALELAPSGGLAGFDPSYLKDIRDFFQQYNPFKNLEIDASALGGLPGVTISNLNVTYPISDSDLGRLIREEYERRANISNQQRIVQNA